MNYIERTTNGTRWEASLDGGKTWHRGGPVSFTADNAQKCFDGQKTQTRRLMNPQPASDTNKMMPWPHAKTLSLPTPDSFVAFRRDGSFSESKRWKPTFRVGGIFYIREPWRTDIAHDKIKPTELPGGAPILFDCALDPKSYLNPGKLRPAMFLQRRFARPARYQITAVRCERVNEISEEDALAEGVKWLPDLKGSCGQQVCKTGAFHAWLGGSSIGMPTAKQAFLYLWNFVHSTGKTRYSGGTPGSRFEDAPWVWAYTFRRVR